MPVAFFSVCLAGIAKDQATLAKGMVVFDTVRPFVTPVAQVLFAGRVNRRSATLFLPNWLARFFPTLDFRDWNKIRGWAQTVYA